METVHISNGNKGNIGFLLFIYRAAIIFLALDIFYLLYLFVEWGLKSLNLM
jgi:hypothetical protein